MPFGSSVRLPPKPPWSGLPWGVSASILFSLCRFMTVGWNAMYQSCIAWFLLAGCDLAVELQHAACLLLISAISALSQAMLMLRQSVPIITSVLECMCTVFACHPAFGMVMHGHRVCMHAVALPAVLWNAPVTSCSQVMVPSSMPDPMPDKPIDELELQ